ncbi:MAG: hypothetical protein ACYCSA_09395 [Thermoplasmataceae archaeon]
MKVRVLIEDSYGPNFISKLAGKLKQGSYLAHSTAVDCRQYTIYKLNTLLKSSISPFDRTVILVDCDGDCNAGNSSMIKSLIEGYGNKKLIPVFLQWEIEEWICISQGIQISSGKPSEILTSAYNYKKYHLPRYADKLNIDELQRSSKSFGDFVKALT